MIRPALFPPALLPLAMLTAAAALPALTAAAAAPAKSAPVAAPVVWDKVCSRCHLTGVGPELRGRALPPEYVRTVVRGGLMAMPAFPHSSIDDGTLDNVAKYVAASRLPKPAAQR